MTKLSLNTKGFVSMFPFRSLNVFVFAFLAWLIASPFLYAAEGEVFVATEVSGDPEYIILAEGPEGFEVVKRGILSQDSLQNPKNPLPALCVIRVPEGATVTLVNEQGQEIKLVGPTVYDIWLGQERAYDESANVLEELQALLPSLKEDIELDDPSRFQ